MQKKTIIPIFSSCVVSDKFLHHTIYDEGAIIAKKAIITTKITLLVLDHFL